VSFSASSHLTANPLVLAHRNTQIRLILELERTSLDSVIKNVKDAKRPPFALHEVKQVALDVALALKYLHMHVTKIVHRDIKVR
jgi:serine/threonine protein kinase